jgi:membrane-associated phospholipid phosphatase
MQHESTDIRKKKPWLSIFTIEFLFVLLLLLALIVFVYAVRIVFVLKTTTFDENIFTVVASYTTSARTAFMNFITFLGKHTLLIPLNLLMIGVFIYRKQKWFAIRIASLALSSVALSFSLKEFFRRDRPLLPVLGDARGYSFPSGHALIGIVFYGLLIYVIWHEVKQKWLRVFLTVFFILLILLISFSRIYLRVHYPSDVIAGMALGFIWLVLSLRIIHRIEKKYIANRVRNAEKLD